MRARSAMAILLALLVSVPVVGGSTTAMQDEEEEITDPCMEDPKLACEYQSVLYLWSNGQSNFWYHFYEKEENGKELFFSDELSCSSCHGTFLFTNQTI